MRIIDRLAGVLGATGPDNLLASKSLVRKKNRAELRGRRRNVRKMAILVAVAALMVALVAGTAAAKGRGGMKTFNFKGTAVSEDGSSISVEVSDGNTRGREAAEAHEQAHPGEPMVFAVDDDTTKVEIDDAPASPKGSACSRSISQPSEMSASRRCPMMATQSSISPSSSTAQNASSHPRDSSRDSSSTASSPEASFGCRLSSSRWSSSSATRYLLCSGT
jgi:hypothetical protein